MESNRERIALLMLAQAKIVVYAPRLRAWRVVRGRRQAREIALFPGYCFVEIALQWHPVCQCPGVIKLVMDGLQPARVPDKVIAEIRARERDGAIDLAPPAPQYRPGDEVRVVQGPFSGHAALFAGLGGHARVAVLLNLLGGSQRAKLPADAIEPIVQAAPALNGNVGNAPHVGDPRARHRARRERQRLRRQSGGGAADCFGHGSSIRRSALCP